MASGEGKRARIAHLPFSFARFLPCVYQSSFNISDILSSGNRFASVQIQPNPHSQRDTVFTTQIVHIPLLPLSEIFFLHCNQQYLIFFQLLFGITESPFFFFSFQCNHIHHVFFPELKFYQRFANPLFPHI